MSQRHRTGRPRRLVRRPVMEGLESRRLLATFVVNSTSDSASPPAGTITLRSAITAANTLGGTNTIQFNISGSATITPATPLPTINNQLTIDGTTEPGYSGKPVVVLDGTGAGTGTNGLTLAAAGATIKALDIVNFNGAGILIDGPGGDTVASSYIGVDSTGSAAAPNAVAGISINASSNNVIGGSSTTGDVISGNSGPGILMTGASSTNNIAFDDIGVDASGSNALGNNVGISATGAKGTLLIHSVVAANVGGGVLFQSGSGNVIASSHLGTDAGGTKALANGTFGVDILGETGDFVGTAGNGNVISGNSGAGVAIFGSNHTTVANNLIGLNGSGTAAIPNADDGVLIFSSATNTTVGGPAGSGNFISGNAFNGVDIGSSSATSGTLVQGNDIGTDITGALGIANVQNGVLVQGTAAVVASNSILGNGQSGVYLYKGSGSSVRGNLIGDVVTGQHGNSLDGIFVYGGSNNTIGGAGLGNIVGANTQNGIEIQSDLADTPNLIAQSNVVLGNFVGLNFAGGQPGFGNSNGIAVFDALGTTIGGTSGGTGNFIGNNANYGIDIDGTHNGATGTLLTGNVVGMTAAVTPVAAPNKSGIVLNLVKGAVVLRNFVSDNTTSGIYVVQGSGSVIATNFIGTDLSGTIGAGNGGDGLDIAGASGTTIGGATDASRNIISGNTGYGINLSAYTPPGSSTAVSATNNTISANWIGVNANGVTALGNGNAGIWVDNVPNNVIGGSTTSHNVIANNGLPVGHNPGSDGVLITGTGAIGTTVVSNFIGVAADGETPGPNGLDGILVQGTGGVNLSFDLASANDEYGIHLSQGATAVVMTANRIGTDLLGSKALPNQVGVVLDGVSGNIVGGTAGSATRNIISGNSQYGVFIAGSTSTANTVEGNYIGTDSTGLVAVANAGSGLLIQGPGNVIGGASTAAQNVISGNGFAGIDIGGGGTGNVVAGNLIGTDYTGSYALANRYYGVYVDGSGTLSATKNNIGLGVASAMNDIVGGSIANVSVLGPLASGTLIAGNRIGTNLAGNLGLGATPFGIIINGAPNNTVGGTAAGAGNTIGASTQVGLQILNTGASGNLAEGNLIGLVAGGNASLANALGVAITNAPNNTIGGAAAGAANTITGNKTNTIQVSGSGSTGNQTTGNVIGS